MDKRVFYYALQVVLSYGILLQPFYKRALEIDHKVLRFYLIKLYFVF